MKAVQKQERDKKQIKWVNNFLLGYFKFILPALAAVILVGGYFLVLAPKYFQIVVDLAEASKVQGESYLKRQEYLDKLLKLNEKFNSLDAANLKKIDAILPNEAEADQLFPQIEALAARNGVFLASLRIEPAGTAKNGGEQNNQAPGAASLKISIKLAGVNYESFKTFLSDLETDLRLTDVNHLDFSPANNTAEFAASTYYWRADGGLSPENK